MPMPMNPRTEATTRMMQVPQGGAIGNKPSVPGQNPQAGAPGGQTMQPGGQPPAQTAIKILELIVQRLGQVNPEAAQKVGAALDQLKTVIEEVKKEATAPGKSPVAGQPAGATPPAAVPSPNQPGGRQMPSQPMPQ